MVAGAEALDKAGKDVFYALGTLKEPSIPKLNKDTGEQEIDDRGRLKWEIRSAKNISHLRCLFLDADIAPEKGKYGTRQEALESIKAFTKKVGLPKPWIVSSGGGFHVYWPFQESIPADDWAQLAQKFKLVCMAYIGAKLDHVPTADRSRVLRVPGSGHYKTGTRREVEIIMEGAVSPLALIRSLIDSAMSTAGIQAAPPQAIMDAFSDVAPINNVPTSPLDFDKLVKNCQQIRYAVEHQAEYTEPLWRAVIMTVRHCTNGEELVHDVSRNYPHYDRDFTNKKLSQIGVSGAARCESFAQARVGGCEGCKHLGKINSPAAVGREIVEQAPPTVVLAPAPVYESEESAVVSSSPAQSTVISVPNPPFPYIRTKDGKIGFREADDDGDETLSVISPYDMYPYRRVLDEVTNEEQTVWKVMMPFKGWMDVGIPSVTLADTRRLITFLLGRGVYIQPSLAKELQAFMVAYVNTLQKSAVEDLVLARLGWRENHTAFAFNNKLFKANETVQVSTDYDKASEYGFGSRGSLEKWVREVNKFYDHPAYLDRQFAVLCGFASVLLPFTMYRGLLVNMGGKAGAGKTTVLSTINSIWGNTDQLMIYGGKEGSTVVGRMEALNRHNNLPVCLDEITNLSPEDARSMVHSISQGQGKRRHKDYGAPENWWLIGISSCNGSLLHKLSMNQSDSLGQAVRVFEIFISQTSTRTKVEADYLNAVVRENYGLAGEAFAQYLVKHVDKVKSLVAQCIAEVDSMGNVDSSERFRSAAIGCVWAAGILANKCGLIQWDINAIVRWGIGQMETLRAATATYQVTSSQVLADFIDVNNGNILVIDKLMNNGRGNGNIIFLPRGKLVGRLELDRKLLYVSSTAFKEYCIMTGADHRRIEQELLESKVLLRAGYNKSLGANTEMEKGLTRCWLIDMTHSDISKMGKRDYSAPVAQIKPDLTMSELGT